jgi:hypothetical protein
MFNAILSNELRDMMRRSEMVDVDETSVRTPPEI